MRTIPREVRIEDRATSDKVKANRLRQLKLSDFEQEFVSGCLLGDGSLTSSGYQYRLRVEHTVRHARYVDWKYKQLARLCISQPQFVPQHQSMRFGTIGHPEITDLRKLWYQPHKQIPGTMVLTPLMLAIWFMDDGTKHQQTVDISIHSFSIVSIDRLRNHLSSYGIETTVNSDGKGRRLYVYRRSYPVFKRLVAPYVIKTIWPTSFLNPVETTRWLQ